MKILQKVHLKASTSNSLLKKYKHITVCSYITKFRQYEFAMKSKTTNKHSIHLQEFDLSIEKPAHCLRKMNFQEIFDFQSSYCVKSKCTPFVIRYRAGLFISHVFGWNDDLISTLQIQMFLFVMLSNHYNFQWYVVSSFSYRQWKGILKHYLHKFCLHTSFSWENVFCVIFEE